MTVPTPPADQHMRLVTVLTLAGALLLGGCTTLSDKRIDQRPPSYALAQETPSRLKQLAFAPPATTPDNSGFVLLDSGLDALAARLWLAEKAEKTLDIQYYIFHGDKTGKLVAGALLAAADRGVRVRVLMDDIYTTEHETSLTALDSHPNIEIRLYNAFHYRGGSPFTRLYEFFTQDGKPNRRMHNKLFAADNQMAITGGRNIGDEYFQAHQELSFVDLDVLASGPVVNALSLSFDTYWNSAAVIPARAIPGFNDARARLPLLREALQAHAFAMASTEYGQSLLDLPLHKKLDAGTTPWLAAQAHVLVDPPEKFEGLSHISETLVGQLLGLKVEPKREMILISPYFVPGNTGTQWLQYLRGQGVSVRILTNSLAANDVPLVHAGYARYREPLLTSGAEIYELKPVPNRATSKRRPIASGSSRASLHAKSFVFDRENVFIGSFNFDPRSTLINTELGMFIRSPQLARQVADLAEAAMQPANSYAVRLQKDENQETVLTWTGLNEGRERVLHSEPESTTWQRFMLKLLSVLPIEENL
jgi:cardiolipin synthase C